MLNLKVNHTSRDVKVLTDQLIAALDRLTERMPQTGTMTMAIGANSTSVANARVTLQSVILLSPMHPNAEGVTYSCTVGTGEFTVFHENNATADRTFGYVIF